MTTPVGPQAMILHIDTLGDTFSGRIESAMGNHDISGTAASGALSWQMKATKPIPITVTFKAQIDGDRFSGTAKLGLLGKSTLSGERMSAGSQPATVDEPAIVGRITEQTVDPKYRDPYVDVNELRQQPVPHRYVHGGFRGTDARFSFYFPERERYQGRFFHNTYPLALCEDIGPFPIAFEVATGDLGFTFDSGAYYVQTNLGGSDRAGMADPAIAAYRVNAAAAKHSRVVAEEIYGAHRPYGYLFGGSGGSYQVIGSAENTSGIWDGFVPFVMATPNAIPSMFTVRMNALRVLRQRDRFPSIMDAINPGGSGDPLATLNDEERAAYQEAALMGYPPRGWWNHASLDSGYFAQVAPLMPMLDPGYIEDFWTKPGYLGSDPASSIHAARFTFETTVTKVIDGLPRHVELAAVPDRDFSDSHLVLLSGKGAGSSVPIATIDGKRIGFAYAADQSVTGSIEAGDRVRIDNSWGLALQTYQRHQLPTPDLYGWNQFRRADGTPIYPQREVLIGPIGAVGTAGSLPNGDISAKMIVVEALMDIDALPWQADWYRMKVKEAIGERFEDSFALWYIDHAQHDNPQTPAAHAHTVSFAGALQQALRDVSAWAEQGHRPSSTQYRIADTQVIVPVTAGARSGIQPVVGLSANGGERAEVAIGETVSFSATIEVPPAAGKVVGAEWDFEGAGNYPLKAEVDGTQVRVQLTAAHAYGKSGTYFAVLRAASQRDGNTQTPYARVQNLARVRVVVR